jgi:hypothetical protein
MNDYVEAFETKMPLTAILTQLKAAWRVVGRLVENNACFFVYLAL